ncbi:pilus assembly protein TadG-related protein [uncultured Jatrophihabitans sp.]|uniref:pilus assembly protein TadG-related protein n=1 Tax=uncultured Jatrophihabitans sp. TaxID=1610747 RepID=UPI0035CC08FC
MKRDDRGSITPMIPVLMFALLLLGGLVIDGSRELNARGDARAYAEEAARAGATAIEQNTPQEILDVPLATARVKQYCNAIEIKTRANVEVQDCDLDAKPFDDAMTCDGTEEQIVVNTVVTVHTDTTLLGMVGFTQFSASAHASARAYEQTFDPKKPYC